MKIGIELNGVIRDINSQILKYYKKDIDRTFEGENEEGLYNVLDSLKFDTKKAKNEFLYIDYPYEIFGCARTCGKNTSVLFNNWLLFLNDLEEGYDVSLFSPSEGDLTIQSSYFFLSKIGSRARNVFFPLRMRDIWKKYDVVITANPNTIKSKPENKVIVAIKNSDNEPLSKLYDMIYQSFDELLDDNDFLIKLKQCLPKEKNGFINKLKDKIKKIF